MNNLDKLIENTILSMVDQNQPITWHDLVDKTDEYLRYNVDVRLGEIEIPNRTYNDKIYELIREKKLVMVEYSKDTSSNIRAILFKKGTVIHFQHYENKYTFVPEL